MEDTNRALALLLVAAIIVSLGGTVVSLNKLGQMGEMSLTGFATSSEAGRVNLSVSENTVLDITWSTIDFGSGYVATGCDNCSMDTLSTGNTNAACCHNDWNTTSGFQDGFWIENKGNTVVNVQLVSNASAVGFIGDGVGGETNSTFKWRISDDLAGGTCGGACTGVNNDDDAASCTENNTGAWFDVDTGVGENGRYICGDASTYPLSYNTSKNELVVDFWVSIPATATSGHKIVSITALGTSA